MFTEQERRVYGPYMDGSGGAAVWGDPLKISRLLTQALSGNPNEVIKEMKSEDSVISFAAMSRVVPAAVLAFELVPFDKKTGKGMLDDEVMKVFEGFCQWMSKKKGKEEPTPTGSSASDGHLRQVYTAGPGYPERTPESTVREIPPLPPRPAPGTYQKGDLPNRQEEEAALANGKAFEEHSRKQEEALTALTQSISRVGLPST